jgi:O-acetyl-ADP-ribose deacetylase (regulator of RNase III)
VRLTPYTLTPTLSLKGEGVYGWALFNNLCRSRERRGVMEERIQIVEGDITKQEVDAIVNAANTSLLGGGGVDGAIHRAAGPELLEETRKIGGCPTGEARVSKGYNLPAKWVIHTVGPIWAGGGKNEENLLANCYRNSFQAARDLGMKTIAFPSISTGAYGFPLERATEITMEETKRFLETDETIEKVVFVCFGETVFNTYKEVYGRVFGG